MAQTKGQYVLQDKIFLKTYPSLCTCVEALDQLSSDVINGLLISNGLPSLDPKYPFIGNCFSFDTVADAIEQENSEYNKEASTADGEDSA